MSTSSLIFCHASLYYTADTINVINKFLSRVVQGSSSLSRGLFGQSALTRSLLDILSPEFIVLSPDLVQTQQLRL